MGRYSIEEQDIKKSFGASAKQKVIDLIGKRKCKDIAEEAINTHYEKLLKKQGK